MDGLYCTSYLFTVGANVKLSAWVLLIIMLPRSERTGQSCTCGQDSFKVVKMHQLANLGDLINKKTLAFFSPFIDLTASDSWL